MRRIIFCLMAGIFIFTSSGQAQNPDEKFKDYCIDSYSQKGVCPDQICQLSCANGQKDPSCLMICLPRPCPSIPADACPLQYCALMTNCSNEKICHYQMYGEKAKCGNLAYSGQDVDCCPGLARRCGIEFYDGSCDMEGKNSVYQLPICIPCGDGICGNFENRCNCPEDCFNPTLDQPISKINDGK